LYLSPRTFRRIPLSQLFEAILLPRKISPSEKKLLATIDCQHSPVMVGGITAMSGVGLIGPSAHLKAWFAAYARKARGTCITAESRMGSVPSAKTTRGRTVGGLLAVLFFGLGCSDGQGQELPALILLQPPQVQQAWREVQAAIRENARQRRPAPEPYFARAEIWSLVNNHDAAMRDYLEAARLSIERGESLETQAGYFNKLYEALDRLDQAPSPAVIGSSKSHYGRGVHAFWRNDLPAALMHFEDAVQLEPADPVNWYYRALTYARLGHARRAQHDVLMAARLEVTGDDRRVAAALARVQGPLRLWLEGFRNGPPRQRIPRTGVQKDKVAARQTARIR
jgi:tetratricopeptide (TPR) repeat protein